MQPSFYRQKHHPSSQPDPRSCPSRYSPAGPPTRKSPPRSVSTRVWRPLSTTPRPKPSSPPSSDPELCPPRQSRSQTSLEPSPAFPERPAPDRASPAHDSSES